MDKSIENRQILLVRFDSWIWQENGLIMGKFFDDIKAGLEEAIEYEKGKTNNMKKKNDTKRTPLSLEDHERIEKFLSIVSREGLEIQRMIFNHYGPCDISTQIYAGIHLITRVKYSLENECYKDYKDLHGIPPALPSSSNDEYEQWYLLYNPCRSNENLRICVPQFHKDDLKLVRKICAF